LIEGISQAARIQDIQFNENKELKEISKNTEHILVELNKKSEAYKSTIKSFSYLAIIFMLLVVLNFIFLDFCKIKFVKKFFKRTR
jgi:hypothetical protein